jgi:hypothetical protein
VPNKGDRERFENPSRLPRQIQIRTPSRLLRSHLCPATDSIAGLEVQWKFPSPRRKVLRQIPLAVLIFHKPKITVVALVLVTGVVQSVVTLMAAVWVMVVGHFAAIPPSRPDRRRCRVIAAQTVGFRPAAPYVLTTLEAEHCHDGGSRVQLKTRSSLWIPLVALQVIVTQPVAAQARGAVTIRYRALSPIVALLAGILILVRPRLLNYVVAIYLILVGLIGIFGM